MVTRAFPTGGDKVEHMTCLVQLRHGGTHICLYYQSPASPGATFRVVDFLELTKGCPEV